MPPSNNLDTLSISRPMQIALTAIVVIIIIGGVGLLTRQPAPEETDIAANSEDWPTPKPSVTATHTGTPIPTALPTETPTPLPTPTPIVIGWRELGTLLSVESTLQTVVMVEREGGFLRPTERILLVAIGNVEAGIDLTQIGDGDVVVNGTSVKVTLPPATITSVELLPSESEIVDTQRRWFLSEYEGLEIEAMDQARTELEDWAVNRGNILKQAEIQAQLRLQEFLRQLGFTEIEITFQGQESG